jgi:Flp pilus assembly protein TadG
MSGATGWSARGRYGRGQWERGAVAVEFALVLPILVMLLLGTVTGGLAYSQSIGVTNAVREAARFGASADASSASWASDVIARVRATQFDDLSATPETAVCVQLYNQGSGPVQSSCDQGDGSVSPALTIADTASVPKVPAYIPSGTCVVRVVAARNFTIITGMAPMFESTAVRGSVARYEKDC